MGDKLNNLLVTGKLIRKIALGKQYDKLLATDKGSGLQDESKLFSSMEGVNTNSKFKYTTVDDVESGKKMLIVEMKPEYSVPPIKISIFDAKIAVKVSSDEEHFTILDH